MKVSCLSCFVIIFKRFSGHQKNTNEHVRCPARLLDLSIIDCSCEDVKKKDPSNDNSLSLKINSQSMIYKEDE